MVNPNLRPDPDDFARFARAHLPSSTERAIYPVLAGAPHRDWKAREVASAARVSHHEADQALRRFAAAGIVDHSHVRGRGHRYRWHPEMAYLRHGELSGLPVDPVCGMPVPPARRTLSATATPRSASAPFPVWSSGRRTGAAVGRRADPLAAATAWKAPALASPSQPSSPSLTRAA